MSTCVPFLEKCLPKEWLTPMALEESVKQTTGQRDSVESSYAVDGEGDLTGLTSRKDSRSSTQGLLRFNVNGFS